MLQFENDPCLNEFEEAENFDDLESYEMRPMPLDWQQMNQ